MRLIEVASGGKEAFEKFFRSALKKFGVSSPAELKGDKKKEFFNFIDKGFKSDKEEKGIPEQAKSGGKEEFEKFFRSALKKFGVSSPAELKGDKKKEFFNFIDKGFKSDKEEKGIAEAVDPKFRRVLGGLNILIKEVGKLEDGIRKVGKEAEIKDAPGQVIKGFNLALGNLEDAEAALQRAKRNIG